MVSFVFFFFLNSVHSDRSALLPLPGKNPESWIWIWIWRTCCVQMGLRQACVSVHTAPANAVVVHMEDKCRVLKRLERLQVGVDGHRMSCVCVCVLFSSYVFTSISICTSQSTGSCYAVILLS